MNKKRSYILLCPVLIVFWFFPVLFYGSFMLDPENVRSLAAGFVFLAAALLCRLLPNIWAAAISAAVLSVGLCLLQPSAVFDTLPVLLLCGWLRCYAENEKGNAATVLSELFTDLIYAYVAAAVIRLIRAGYTFIKIETADTHTFPDLCLMALVFLLFFVCFLLKTGNETPTAAHTKEKKKRGSRAERKIVGLIPVTVSPRTFWGFAALLLAACLLQYTNCRLTAENILFLRSGFRLLFFPWMVLLFFALDAFSPRIPLLKPFAAK